MPRTKQFTPVADAERDASQRLNCTASAKTSTTAVKGKDSGRRRLVDSTACECDFSKAEFEFMQAMQAYKQSSGRMFPTWSEVLEVLRSLGYTKA